MQNFNSTVGFQSNRQLNAATTLLPQNHQQQQQQQQQQRFNQRRHFGAAKQVYNSSSGSLGNAGQQPQSQTSLTKPAASHRGSLSETMRIFERSQQQHLQSRKQPAATPSTGALPPLETTARRSNASSGQKPAVEAANNEPPTKTSGNAADSRLDANQNYLPIITTSRSDGVAKLTARQQPTLAAAAMAATAPALSSGAKDAKSDTGAEPPTVRPGINPGNQQQPLPPPPQPPPALLPSNRVQQQLKPQQHQPQQQQQQQSSQRKSANNRRRRVKGVVGAGRKGTVAPLSIKTKPIPIVYFSPENGSVRSGRLDDVDSRSCDLRDPNATIAYSSVLEYIRDNQLMSSRKAKLIWAWIRDQDAASSAGLFVYDPNLRWYSLPGELVGGADA